MHYALLYNTCCFSYGTIIIMFTTIYCSIGWGGCFGSDGTVVLCERRHPLLACCCVLQHVWLGCYQRTRVVQAVHEQHHAQERLHHECGILATWETYAGQGRSKVSMRAFARAKWADEQRTEPKTLMSPASYVFVGCFKQVTVAKICVDC